MTRTSLAERLDEEGRDELTPAEAREYAEEQVKKYLGLTVEEFIDAAERDELPRTASVLHLALLLGVELKSC